MGVPVKRLIVNRKENRDKMIKIIVLLFLHKIKCNCLNLKAPHTYQQFLVVSLSPIFTIIYIYEILYNFIVLGLSTDKLIILALIYKDYYLS